MRLERKVVIITLDGRGIGRAIASSVVPEAGPLDIVWDVSDEARFVTGQVIQLDWFDTGAAAPTDE